VAGVVLLLAAGSLLLGWRQSMEHAAMLRQQRNEMKASAEEAKSFIGRVNAAREWYDRRSNYLECLRALTLRLPEDGSVWTSSLSLREDMRGVLTGSAVDEKSVLEFVYKLRSGAKPKVRPEFADVKIDHTRAADVKNSEISFAVSFAFLGGE
jgi:hypothetical protein